MPLQDELTSHAVGRPTVCTIGVFDGVHAGHRALIQATIGAAARQHAASAVLVLYPHPRSVLSPGNAVPVITPLDERLDLIKACGVDVAVPITFDRDLANLTAREFAAALVRHLHMTGLVIGADFALGRDRSGNAAALQEIGTQLGFEVTIIPLVALTDAKVSSTAVRTALAEGDVAGAARMLERPLLTRGTVMHGHQRGRQLGYPTANLRPDSDRALPADGIYATRTYVGDQVYDSATYVGTSPTFDGQERIIEVLLFDFNGDLYDAEIAVEWVDKVRGDQKFASAEALQQQMALDVGKAKLMRAATPDPR